MIPSFPLAALAGEPPVVDPPPADTPAAEPVQKAKGDGDRIDPPWFLIGPRIGGLVPLSQAGLTYDLGLEAGAQFLFERQLGALVSASFRRPTRTVTVNDPRVPGGSWSARLADPEVSMLFGLRYLHDPAATVVPFGAIGVGVHMVKSEVEGDAQGVAFGETIEQSTEIGLGLRGGVGLRLGPGLATAAAELDLAPLKHLVTGETRSSAFSIALGYLFLL